MKEFLKTPFATILTIFIGLFIYSFFGPRIPISIVSQQKGEPLVITEEGKSYAISDIAKVSLGIEENGQNLKTVQNNVNQKSKNLVSELKKLRIEEKEIKTTSYNIYPEYNYESQPPKISGYRVSANYEVTIENFEKINEVLVKATEAGSNVIGNISLELKDETKQKALDDARELAVKKAKEKAKSLAKAADISLGRILNISESEGNFPERPVYTKASLEADQSIQPDIQPGETEIIVNITISWEIK